jgi:hypothetical protein
VCSNHCIQGSTSASSSVSLHLHSPVRRELRSVWALQKNHSQGYHGLTVCLHCQLFHAFHLWGEARLQPPPPTFIYFFIGIRMRPSRFGTWRTWRPLLRQHRRFGPGHSSRELCTFTCIRPRAMTQCLSPMKFQDFAFQESSLHLIPNIPMLELAKWPLSD